MEILCVLVMILREVFPKGDQTCGRVGLVFCILLASMPQAASMHRSVFCYQLLDQLCICPGGLIKCLGCIGSSAGVAGAVNTSVGWFSRVLDAVGHGISCVHIILAPTSSCCLCCFEGYRFAGVLRRGVVQAVYLPVVPVYIGRMLSSAVNSL